MKEEHLWMAFVDLEYAFEQVSHEGVCWALRCFGVDEWIVSVTKVVYENATETTQLLLDYRHAATIFLIFMIAPWKKSGQGIF